MQTTFVFFNEEQLCYLQETLNVSRKELIETIILSSTSATEIANYVKKRKLGIRSSSVFINYSDRLPDILKLLHSKSKF